MHRILVFGAGGPSNPVGLMMGLPTIKGSTNGTFPWKIEADMATNDPAKIP